MSTWSANFEYNSSNRVVFEKYLKRCIIYYKPELQCSVVNSQHTAFVIKLELIKYSNI